MCLFQRSCNILNDSSPKKHLEGSYRYFRYTTIITRQSVSLFFVLKAHVVSVATGHSIKRMKTTKGVVMIIMM